MNPRSIQLVREDCQKALKNRADQLSGLRNSHLVVTGGTGFLGTWIAEFIACLNDDFSFSTKLTLLARGTESFRNSRPHLANRSDITLLKADVRHLSELPTDTHWVLHAASNPDSRFHSTNPFETMTSIGHGTANVLRALDRTSDLRLFLNVSSGLVYGAQPEAMPRIAESYSGSFHLNSASKGYAEAKRYGEILCSSYRSQFQLPTATVRPFAFIGPYQSLTSPWAINNFMSDAISGKPIRILGDGKTVRSYMYPSDMAFWYLKILTSAKSGTQYNLGSPEPVELQKLAELVSSYAVPKSDVSFISGSSNHTGSSSSAPSRLVPDVTSAHETFDLDVTVPLTEAISRTMDWHRLNL